jgi:hypothetical protein
MCITSLAGAMDRLIGVSVWLTLFFVVTNQALKKFCEESCGLQFRVLLVRRLHQGYFQRDCVAYRLLCGDETGELLDKAAALGRGEWGSIQRTSPIVVEKVFCRCFCCYCHSYPQA